MLTEEREKVGAEECDGTAKRVPSGMGGGLSDITKGERRHTH